MLKVVSSLYLINRTNVYLSSICFVALIAICNLKTVEKTWYFSYFCQIYSLYLSKSSRVLLYKTKLLLVSRELQIIRIWTSTATLIFTAKVKFQADGASPGKNDRKIEAKTTGADSFVFFTYDFPLKPCSLYSGLYRRRWRTRCSRYPVRRVTWTWRARAAATPTLWRTPTTTTRMACLARREEKWSLAKGICRCRLSVAGSERPSSRD